jgi:hypothetical protein
MVRGLRALDPNQLLELVPAWIGALRHEANAALGELELGLRRATDDLAVAVANDADPNEGPPLETTARASAQFLETVRPLLTHLAERMIRARSEGSPLEALCDQPGGELILAAQERWDREIRWAQERVGEYMAGFLTGGGLTLALLTELPPDLACHTGEVAAIASEHMLFVAKRAEQGVTDWIAMVHREADSLLITRSPQKAPSSTPSRLEKLLTLAAELGVRVRNVPENASEAYLNKLEAQLKQMKKDREPAAPDDPLLARLGLLLRAASELRLKVKDVPTRPSAAYLDKMQEKLREVARSKGLPLPTVLAAIPAIDAAALDGAVTVDLPPQPPPPQRSIDKAPTVPSPDAYDDLDERTHLQRPFLVLGEGTPQEQSWPVTEEKLTVGRARANSVHIRNDPGLSRNHATLCIEEGRWTLYDHGSTKGTTVNGRKVRSSIVLSGHETIQMSETKFVLRLR